jgi:hypothetical protein
MIQTINNIVATLGGVFAQFQKLSLPKTVGEAVALIKTVFFSIIGSMDAIYILALAAFVAVCAFGGFKIYKMVMYGASAVAFAFAVKYFSGKILPFIAGYVPAGINTVAVLMALAAIVAMIITRYRRKFMVSLLGAAVGYAVGVKFIADMIIGYFPTLTFLRNKIFFTIVGVLCAIVLFLVFRLVFEHLVVLLTGIGGMATCGLLLGLAIMPGAGKMVLIIFIAAGAALGILAVIHQYNEEAKTNDIFYSYKL